MHSIVAAGLGALIGIRIYKYFNDTVAISDLKLYLGNAKFKDISQRTYTFENSENLLEEVVKVFRNDLEEEAKAFSPNMPHKVADNVYNMEIRLSYEDVIEKCEIVLNETERTATVTVVFK